MKNREIKLCGMTLDFSKNEEMKNVIVSELPQIEYIAREVKKIAKKKLNKEIEIEPLALCTVLYLNCFLQNLRENLDKKFDRYEI